MDFRQNVTDRDDFERLSPTPDELQHHDDEFFPGLGVISASEDHFLDPAYAYGYGTTNNTLTQPAPDSHGETQGMTNTQASQIYDEIVTAANTAGNDGSAYGYGDGNAVPVTGFHDPILFNMLRDLEAPEVAQTTLDATEDPTHTQFHRSQSLFESGDQTNYPLPNFPYNTNAAATNFVPVAAGLNRTFLSPTMDNYNPQASLPAGLGSPPVDFIDRSRKRRATSSASRDTPEASRLKKQCAGCEKAFYTSKDPGGLRCTRCYDKHVKHTAGHTVYAFDSAMTMDSAWHHLYPTVAPMAIVGDDVEAGKANEQDFIHRLIDAVSTPYVSDGSGSKEDQQRMAQQAKLNKKPFDSTQYRDHLVNARIRFLFYIAVSYHAGGPSFYDTGGDNSGYGEDRTMKFSERVERIIQLLTFDKDIAMDVIEGRGVTALVHNPNKYERRKRDNKKSNDTKQDLQEKGKQLHMLERGASASPAAPLEPALPSQFPSSRGVYLADPSASASAHASSSRQRVPSSAGRLANTHIVASGGMNDLEGYVPASHNP